MAKRLKSDDNSSPNDDYKDSIDDDLLLTDIDKCIQATTNASSFSYHTSVCGSLLYSSPTNSRSDIFSYLRHGNFEAFRRSLDVFHNEIIQMRNEHRQTVLHILVIHAYKYVWVRLMMMRGCDTRAQDIDGYTAAHYAVERDDVEMLKALTHPFHSNIRPIPEEQIQEIHRQSLEALTLKTKHGLTVFMLACHHESVKCLNYLMELHIDDSNLQDNFGDTCLHYAAARRNPILVETLITKCQANVNNGSALRPSVLDIVRYNLLQQKPYERAKDEEIERLLVSSGGKTRCLIRRIVNSRAGTNDNDTSITPDFTTLEIDPTRAGQIEVARNFAQRACAFRDQGNLNDAYYYFKQALLQVPDDTLDWAMYAYEVALGHMAHNENHLALELLQKALIIKNRLAQNSTELDEIQQAIISIQSKRC